MRRTAPIAVLFLLPAALDAQGRRPNFAQPTLPPPSITEYQPRSTLVVPENPVPRAKYPVVDLHGHPPRSPTRPPSSGWWRPWTS